MLCHVARGVYFRGFLVWTTVGLLTVACVKALIDPHARGADQAPPASATATDSSPAVRDSKVVESKSTSARSPVGGTQTRIWKNHLGMEFVRLQPGEFVMGTTPEQVDRLLKIFPGSKADEFRAEQPAHVVRLTKPFSMSKDKVTIGQFHHFVAATQYPADANADSRIGAAPRPWFPQTVDQPMVNVSWHDVHAFCDWLNSRDPDGVQYRLPTEAEWEYACHAGTTTLFSNGDDPEKLALIGNVADASARKRYPDWTWSIKADDGHVYTSPIGSYPPNPWGIRDMIGNVWEWCEDGFDPDLYRSLPNPSVDPLGPSQNATKVVRGGNWFIHPRRNRPADRGGFAGNFRCSFLGFRLVAVPKN